MQIVRVIPMLILLVCGVANATNQLSFNYSSEDFYFINVPVNTVNLAPFENIKQTCESSLNTSFEAWNNASMLRKIQKASGAESKPIYAGTTGVAFEVGPRRAKRLRPDAINADGIVACRVTKAYWDQYAGMLANQKSDDTPPDDPKTNVSLPEQTVPDGALVFKQVFLGMKVPLEENKTVSPDFLSSIGYTKNKPVQTRPARDIAKYFTRKTNRSQCGNECREVVYTYASQYKSFLFQLDKKDETITVYLDAENTVIAFDYKRRFDQTSGVSNVVLESAIKEQFATLVDGAQRTVVDGAVVLQKEPAYYNVINIRKKEKRPVVAFRPYEVVRGMISEDIDYDRFSQGFVIGHFDYLFRAYDLNAFAEIRQAFLNYEENQLAKDAKALQDERKGQISL